MTSPKSPSQIVCKGCGDPWFGKSGYCLTCRTVIVYDGYTREQLSKAFDQVKNPENWKLPISTIFPESLDQESIRLLDAAIVFYVGSKPVFELFGDSRTRVTAPGYYQSVGG